MKVSLEYLYHYQCDSCQKWWTTADIEPAINSTIYCPHCGVVNVIEDIQSFLVKKEGDCP